MAGTGEKRWIIPAGFIPFRSTGKEPDFLSQDRISVLNTGDKAVEIAIVVFYSNMEPVGTYKIKIQGKRVRKIRINDIIDPFPVPLETDYALQIEAEGPVVVQFTKVFSGSAKAATMGTIAYGNNQ